MVGLFPKEFVSEHSDVISQEFLTFCPAAGSGACNRHTYAEVIAQCLQEKREFFPGMPRK